ncbi:MAG: hypothetical protein CMB99_16415 [Flavobacteriaceae bacterium]|nr:hypothetical protein [Flavobacteriaceae bacterium]|tara:strand:- start:26526 stop:29555 length:3030 start_codon:yes stop_codon:yes gene_type:complete
MDAKNLIKLLFSAENEITPETEEMAQSLDDLREAKRQADAELKDTNAQLTLIKKYKDLEGAVEASDAAFKEAAASVEQLEREMSSAGVPTQEMADALNKARLQAAAAERSHKGYVSQLTKMQAKVTATGADVKELSTAEARLEAQSKEAATASGRLGDEIKKAGRSASEAEGEVKGLSTSWSNLLSKVTLVGAAIGGLILGLKSFVTGASNAEYSNRKLERTLRQVSGATEQQIQALKDQAAALQQTTRFSDEEIKASQEKLATYGLTAAQVQKLTPLLLDMAEAKRESGDADADTIGSAEAIGDAVRDNITALESFGVNITDATEAQYAAAGETERMALVVENLSKSFEGAAENAGVTFAGAMDITANKVAESLESWSAFITENESIKALLRDVAELFGHAADSAKDNSALMVGAVDLVASTLRGAVNITRVFVNTFQIGFNSAQIAVAKFAQGFFEALAGVNEFFGRNDAAEWAQGIADSLGTQVTETAENLQQNFKELDDAIEKTKTSFDAFGTTAEKSKEQTEAAASGLESVNNQLETTGKNADDSNAKLGELFAELGLNFKELSTGVGDSTQKAISSFGAIIEELGKTEIATEDLQRILGEGLTATLEKIKTPEGFKQLEEQIQQSAKATDGLAGTITGTLLPGLETHLEKMEAQGVFVDEVDARYARWAETLGITKDQLAGLGENAEEAAEDIRETAKATEDVNQSITESTGKAAEQVRSTGSMLADFFNAASALTYSLSEKAGQAFEANLGRSVATGVEYYTEKAEQALQALERSMTHVTTNPFQKWMKGVAVAAREVEVEFYQQKASVEKLAESFDATETPSIAMIRRAETMVGSMDLLDDASLSGLRGQIEQARAAFDQLEQSAANTLASIDQRLAQAQGRYADAAAARYESEIQAIDVELEEARKQGNREAIEDLQEAKKKLERLQKIEVQKAKDQEKRAKEDRINSGPSNDDVLKEIAENTKGQKNERSVTLLIGGKERTVKGDAATIEALINDVRSL